MIIYEEPSPEAYDAEENAFPAAGPVTVTFGDGSTLTRLPVEGGDQPNRLEVRGVERPNKFD